MLGVLVVLVLRVPAAWLFEVFGIHVEEVAMAYLEWKLDLRLAASCLEVESRKDRKKSSSSQAVGVGTPIRECDVEKNGGGEGEERIEEDGGHWWSLDGRFFAL